jgi:hypothetical protein
MLTKYRESKKFANDFGNTRISVISQLVLILKSYLSSTHMILSEVKKKCKEIDSETKTDLVD